MGAAALVLPGEALLVLGGVRVDQRGAGQVDAQSGRAGLDGLGVAEDGQLDHVAA